MAERPIILFGEPAKAKKDKGKPGFSSIQIPSHSRQVERLTPKMDALKQTVLTLQASSTGIEPEMALVFELARACLKKVKLHKIARDDKLRSTDGRGGRNAPPSCVLLNTRTEPFPQAK